MINSSFSTVTPNLQLAWDSTSLSAFKQCPRLYYYSIVLGYEPKQRSYHLTFGLLYHSALETYDHERSRGMDHDSATCAAVYQTLVKTWDKQLQRPWNSGDSYKNRFTLTRTIVWYLDHFADDPIRTIQLANGKPAVELSFRYEFPFRFSNGETVVACGHLDRLGEISGSTWVVDRKTTKHDLGDRFFEQFTPDTQMTWYTLAGKVIGSVPVQGVILDGAQILVNSSRFQRQPISRTQSQLDEFISDIKHYLRSAEQYAEDSYWPQNTASCFNFGGCKFRSICSRSPEVRDQFLNDQTMFQKRIWDPLQVRGDV